MKIEVLFPEFCNLNGDMANITYLKKCIPEAQMIETSIEDEPAFCKQNDINLIYMGTLSESAQEIVIQKLKPYQEIIQKSIKEGKIFLFTGNSIEVLGDYIENEDGSKIQGLGIFHVYAKRDMLHRHNSFFLGEYENIEIVGFKSQFTMLYGNNENNYFIKVKMGIGIHPDSKLEGIHEKNFFATYLSGPFLILNPLFTKELMKKMGIKEPKLAFEQDILKAYEVRLAKFKTISNA